jgi:hypothetical protein
MPGSASIGRLPVGEDDMGITGVLDGRKTQYERVLQDLIEKSPARFDHHLDAALPTAHGLYAISMIRAPEGEYLHIGKTASGRNGLRGRVWEQHCQTGGSPGDLLEKVKPRGHGGNPGDAREWYPSGEPIFPD